MKRALINLIILSTIFVINAASGIGQSYKQNIKSEFKEYFNLLVNKEFEASMDYLLPEFFEILPREQMLEVMEETFNSPDVEFELSSPEIIVVTDADTVDYKHYAILTYSNLMNMKFLETKEESEEEKNKWVQFTTTSFEETFGSGNVVYNPETEFYEITVKNKVVAVSQNGQNEWKFLSIEKNQTQILEQLLPPSIFEKAIK